MAKIMQTIGKYHAYECTRKYALAVYVCVHEYATMFIVRNVCE